MTVKTVVLDASVLYPAPLRDLLMHAAITGLFRVKWTETIHEEWINALLRQRTDLIRTQLECTRDLMVVGGDGALVGSREMGKQKVTRRERFLGEMQDLLPGTHQEHGATPHPFHLG